jgi:hypothetical protein
MPLALKSLISRETLSGDVEISPVLINPMHLLIG